jgi:hypothetical protein
MYITDIRHLLDASEKMPNAMPTEARDIVGFLTLIIDVTTKKQSKTLTTTAVRCFKKGCSGMIKSSLMPKSEEIHWYCPDCENEGVINNWQGTEWDNSIKQK